MTAFTWNNYVARNWRGKGLQPSVAELLLLFHLQIDHVLSREDIILFMWPDADDEPDYAPNLVSQYVARIRCLYGVGTITTVSGLGYMMKKSAN